MRGKVSFKSGKFDLSKIDADIQGILRQAAKVYVLEAFRYIPVDTGMARGSLRPLASFLNVHVDISPKRSLPGKNIYEGARRSNFDFRKDGNIHRFEWQANVKHYFLNELIPLPSNYQTPWASLAKGVAKVRNYLRSRGPELARITKSAYTTRSN